jgi:catechol 2,3-dioxygenase-like lactoylglutathione lyase family enzyme
MQAAEKTPGVSVAAGTGTAQHTRLASLVPMAHVSDVAKSADFYRLLGFEVKNTFEQEGKLQWAWLQNGGAGLMLSRSSRPMNPGAQDVLFYMYAPDVAAYRAELESKGVKAGPIKYPFYSPRGEFRIDDPDGYTLFVSHAD